MAKHHESKKGNEENLLEAWRETVRRRPDAVAVIDAASGDVFRRAEVEAAVQAWRETHVRDLANREKANNGKATKTGLASLEGQRVAMVERNGLAWFQVFLGLLSARAVPVALDPGEPAETQSVAARALGASCIWREGAFARAEATEPEKTKSESAAFEGVESKKTESIGARSRTEARSPAHCLVKVTSGSSGLPKGLAFTHAQMAADGRQICATMGIGPHDLNLAVIPLGHSYGLGNLVLPLLLQGTAIVCAASPLPQSLASDCARWKPTVFPAVPPLLRALVRSDISAGALASLRLVISAGSVLPAETAAAFHARFKRLVHGFYGSSETGGICYDREGEATLEGRSVGRPLQGVTLKFPAGPSAAGRFTVVSAAVLGAGRHRPGDRGRLNDRGELVLLGRADRLIKLGARRVDLGEIESALRSILGVRQAWAAPHPSKEGALAAVVATDLPASEIRRRLSQRTASWKIPTRLITVPELPTTPRGKPDPRRLRLLIQDDSKA